MLGSLLFWPVKTAVGWATWYVMRDFRTQLYRLITSQFYKMIMPSYANELNLDEWVIVNRKASRKLQSELMKKMA